MALGREEEAEQRILGSSFPLDIIHPLWSFTSRNPVLSTWMSYVSNL